jgi:hypothetical protein
MRGFLVRFRPLHSRTSVMLASCMRALGGARRLVVAPVARPLSTQRINKVYASADEAVADIKDGSTMCVTYLSGPWLWGG